MKYAFGNCVLCTEEFTLLVDGLPCRIEPQVFDLLRVLLEGGGALVSHDALIEQVWGGRIVSDAAISARISAARAAIGDDGARQEWIRTIPRRGFRFLGAVRVEGGEPAAPARTGAAPLRQQIGFCHSRDGTRIAYARSGDGPPLVRAGHWLTHLEHDWASPVWRPLLEEFSHSFTFWRHDQRGNGLSERDPADLSLEASVDDLDALVQAAGLDRFILYGTSQGAPIAVRYALRHPDRVSHLILHGGYAHGRRLRRAPGEKAMSEALVTLIREGWGRPGSAFLRAFAAVFIPDGTHEQIASLAEMQRLSTSIETAVRLREAADSFDVTRELSAIMVPTLVLHARDDAVHPLDQGLSLAAGIHGARFVQLDSANHVILPQEPAWQVLFDEIRRFADVAGD